MLQAPLSVSLPSTALIHSLIPAKDTSCRALARLRRRRVWQRRFRLGHRYRRQASSHIFERCASEKVCKPNPLWEQLSWQFIKKHHYGSHTATQPPTAYAVYYSTSDRVVDYATRSLHSEPSRIIAFRRINNTRMQAISATFAHFPLSRRALYRALNSG